MRSFVLFALVAACSIGGTLRVHAAASASAPARGRGAITRTATTTPLSGEALASELDWRYGIWLVGQTLSATATLPESSSADQAISLLRAAVLRDQPGCQIEEVPGTNHKIFHITSAAHPAPPLHYGNDPDKIADTDDVIIQIIPFQHLSAGGWAFDGQPLTATRSDCLIITDASTKVRRIAAAFVELDVPQVTGDTAIQYRQLTHANAGDAARALKAALGKPAPIPATGLVRIPAQLYVDFDSRTNTVVLTGPTDQIAQALKMLDQLDAAATAPATTAPATTSGRAE